MIRYYKLSLCRFLWPAMIVLHDAVPLWQLQVGVPLRVLWGYATATCTVTGVDNRSCCFCEILDLDYAPVAGAQRPWVPGAWKVATAVTGIPTLHVLARAAVNHQINSNCSSNLSGTALYETYEASQEESRCVSFVMTQIKNRYIEWTHL